MSTPAIESTAPPFALRGPGAWSSRRLALHGLASAAALTLACPPFQFAWLAWLALVPLLRAAWSTSPARAFVLGTLASGLHHAALGSWLLESGVHVGAFALGDLYCSSYLGLFAGFASWCHRRGAALEPLVLAAAFALLEWARASAGWLGVGWAQLGHTQQAVPALATLAGAAGTYGVSFTLLAFNAALTGLLEARSRPALRPRARWAAGAAGLACLLLAGAAQLRFSTGAPGSLRVGIVQAGVYDPRRDPPSRASELLARYRELSVEAARERPDLIVWPESAAPALSVLPELEVLARDLGVDLLVAASGRDKTSPGGERAMRANSVFLVSARGGTPLRYDKIRLLPFNEFIPWRDALPWPRWIAPELADAIPGTERTVFEVRGVRFSVLVCWENLFAGDFQQSARNVDLMMSLTNEAFAGDTLGRKLLLQWNAMRAAENGVPLVRAGTTGISAVIGPDGSVARRLGSGRASETGWLVADVAVPRSQTLYARVGDRSLLVLALALLPVLARRRSAAA